MGRGCPKGLPLMATSRFAQSRSFDFPGHQAGGLLGRACLRPVGLPSLGATPILVNGWFGKKPNHLSLRYLPVDCFEATHLLAQKMGGLYTRWQAAQEVL
jgi:hypothetical protein